MRVLLIQKKYIMNLKDRLLEEADYNNEFKNIY